MTDIIQIELGKIQTLAASMSSESQRIQHVIDDLNDNLNVLYRGGWEADAADIFYRQMDIKVMQRMERVFKSLREAEITCLELVMIFAGADDEASSQLREQYDVGTKGTLETVKRIDTLLGAAFDLNLYEGLISKGFVQPVTRQALQRFSEMSTDQIDDYMKTLVKSEAFSRNLKLGIGAFDGVIDFGFGVYDGTYEITDIDKLGLEVTSGVLQSSLAFIPGGQAVLVGDAIVQLGGTGVAMGLDFLGYPEAANDVQEFFEIISLDNVADTVVETGANLIGDAVEWLGF